MIRLLPIILLALGLVLAFSSFTRAEASLSAAQNSELVCLEAGEAEPAVAQPDRKPAVCWKKIRSGLLIIPCPPDPSLIAPLAAIAAPEAEYPCFESASHAARDVAPIMPLPPPKA